MFAVLRVRDFRLLWSARLTSSLGSWLLVVAAPAYVYQISGSLIAVGLAMAAEYLPVLLLGPIAGALADRWDRRLVMVAMDLARVAAVSLLLFVRSPESVWVLYVAMAAESVGSVLFQPAAQAMTPAVVGTGKALSSAGSLNAVSDSVVRLTGPPLGAALMVVTGFHVLVALDMASYVVSAVLIYRTAGRYGLPSGTRTTVRAVMADLIEGVKFIRRQPMARALLPVMVLFLTANASLSALLVPFGVTHWGGEREVALVISSLGAGFLIGAPLIRWLIDRVQPRFIMAGALTATGLGFAALFGSAHLVEAMGSALAIGMFGSLVLVAPQITLQRVVPNAVLGRASATFFTAEALATLIGAIMGPAVAQNAGFSWAVDIACVATLVTALLSLAIVPMMDVLVPPSPS